MIKLKIFFISLSLILLSSTSAFSQNYIDIFKAGASTTPDNSFDTSTAKTKINQLEVDLTIPVKINDRFSIISGLTYEAIQTKLFPEDNMKSFGSATLKLGANRQFNDNWSGTLVLLPKIASDYKTVNNEDFQMGTLALLKNKKSDNLIYKFGLYYNSELFGPFFVPMAGVYYLSENKKLETNIMLPLQADLNYNLIPLVTVGANFTGQTRTYNLNDIKTRHGGTYIARTTNEIYGYLKFNITKSFSIQTKLGQSIGRSFRVYDENDKVTFSLPTIYIGHKRQPLNSDFSDGQIFQIVLLYRFNFNN